MFARRPIQINVWLTVFTSDSLLSFSRRIFAPFEEPGLRSPIYFIFGGELIQKEIPMGKTTLIADRANSREVYCFAGGFRCPVLQQYHISLTRKHENYRETSPLHMLFTLRYININENHDDILILIMTCVFQVIEHQPYDSCCDWWSLGVMLYYMLTSKVCDRSYDYPS